MLHCAPHANNHHSKRAFTMKMHAFRKSILSAIVASLALVPAFALAAAPAPADAPAAPADAHKGSMMMQCCDMMMDLKKDAGWREEMMDGQMMMEGKKMLNTRRS